MTKHSKKVRSFALKSLIVLATLVMVLSVVPGEEIYSEAQKTSQVQKAPKAEDPPLNELVSGVGAKAEEKFGWNVSYAGDLNGDGIDDIIVGAPYNDSADGSITDCGAVYIFFGKSSWSAGDLDAANADVVIYGAKAEDHFGWSVSYAGNIDGDGDCVIIGAPDNDTADGTKASAGAVYIFNTSAFSSSGLTWYATDANYTIYGENAGDKFGHAVASAGDISLDNFTDTLVGAPGFDDNRGKVYVISFNSTLITSGTYNYSKDEVPDLAIPDNDPLGSTSTLTIPNNGTIADIRMFLKINHTYVGDLIVNITHPDGTKLTLFGRPDGSNDNLWGWYEKNTTTIPNGDPLHNLSIFEGKYSKGNWELQVSDRSSGDTGVIDLWSVEITYGYPTTPYLGERIGDMFGYSIGPLGDTNGDGYDDFIVGAPGADSNKGKAYVFSGNATRGNPATKIYNFVMGGGVDKRAFYDNYESGTFDVAKFDQYPPVSELTSGNYPRIAVPDNAYVYLDTDDAIYWRFNFTVTEQPDFVSGIYISTKLITEAATAHYVYIWNNRISRWERIHSFTPSYIYNNTWCGAILTNVTDYINTTSGNISIHLYRGDVGAVARYFGVDYIDGVLTYRSGMAVIGENSNDRLGSTVSDNIANINADVYRDIIVGAPGYNSNTGRVYISYGGSSLPKRVSAGGANITITGTQTGDQFGYLISSGNLIGNSCSEIIVGAPYNDSAFGDTSNCGAIYVFNGSGSMPSTISALDANYTNYGEAADDSFGFSVSYAGDVNNEGYDEVLVGAPFNDSTPNAGKVYVLTVAVPNQPPTPTNLGVQGYLSAPDILNITDHTPDLNYTYTDPEGDTQSWRNVSVYDSSWSLIWWSNVSDGLNTSGSNIVITYAGPALTDGCDYYFNVTCNDTGSNNWSAVASVKFHMNSLPTTTLTAPANNTWTNDNTPLFDWDYSDAIEGSAQSDFNVSIDNDPAFTSIDYWANQTSSNSQWQFPDGTGYSTLPDGTWYWRVKTSDGYEWGDWCADYYVINIDTVLPETTIDDISDYVNSLNSITGTASDVGSGVNKTQIRIYNVTGGTNWTGNEWATAETWLNATGYASWSYDSSGVAWQDGCSYTIYANATDNATNVGSPPAQDSFTYDTTSPTVTATTPSDGGSTSNVWQNVSFAFSEAMNTSVAPTIASNMSGTITYWWESNTKLWVNHSLELTGGSSYYVNISGVEDLAGNLLVNGYENITFTVAETVGVVVAPDGGEYWAGGSVHNIVYTIAGGVPNYEVWLNYTTDGTSWQVCSGPAQPVTHTSAGTFTYAWTLPSGVNSSSCKVKVEVVDSGTPPTNNSDESNTPFTIDSEKPTSEVDTISPYWRNSAITITASASDSYSSVKNVTLWYRYSTNNDTWDPWVVFLKLESSPWSWNFDFPNGTGYYEFYTRANDTALSPGNYEDAPAQRDALCGFDNVKPCNPTSYTSEPAVDTWSNDTTVEVTWSGATDVLSGIAGYYYAWTTTATYTPTESDNFTALTSNTSLKLNDNANWYLHVRAKDNASNLNNSAYHIGPFKIDTVLPTSTIATPSVDPAYYNLTPIWLNGTCSDLGDVQAGINRTEIKIIWKDNGTTYLDWTDTNLAANYSWWNYSFNPPNEANFTIYIRAVDNASNYQPAVMVNITYDITPPSNPTPPAIEQGGAQNNTWQNFVSAPTFEWSWPSDNVAGIDGFYWYFGTSETGTSTNYITTNSTSVGTWENGTYYFRIRTRDKAGNNASWITLFVFRHDAALPYSTIENPAEGNTTDVTPIWINGTCNDTYLGVNLSGVNRIEINISWKDNGTTYLTWTQVNLAANYSWWNYSFTPPTEGNYTIKVRAVDNVSNVGAIVQINITYSKGAPTVTINYFYITKNNDTYTNTQDVVLNLSVSTTDATAVKVRFKNEDWGWSKHYEYNISNSYNYFSWRLTRLDGNKIVYVEVNATGAATYTLVYYKDNITLDGTAPSIYDIKINDIKLEPGMLIRNRTVNISAILNDIGLDSSNINWSTVIVRIDGNETNRWEESNKTTVPDGWKIWVNWSFSTDGQTHTVYVEVKDYANNSATTEWSFVVDTTPLADYPGTITFSHYHAVPDQKVQVYALVYNNKSSQQTFDVTFGFPSGPPYITSVQIPPYGTLTVSSSWYTIKSTDGNEVTDLRGRRYKLAEFRVTVTNETGAEDNQTATLVIVSAEPPLEPVSSFELAGISIFVVAALVALLSALKKRRKLK